MIIDIDLTDLRAIIAALRGYGEGRMNRKLADVLEEKGFEAQRKSPFGEDIEDNERRSKGEEGSSETGGGDSV
jgi:membrane-bound lytic murein transglycosylase B